MTGSGKSLIPCERMHLAKLKYPVSSCACCAELALAASLEPPHAAASMASPAEAVIATATRGASGDTRRGQDTTRVPSFIASPSVAAVPVLALKTKGSSASAQDRAAILLL